MFSPGLTKTAAAALIGAGVGFGLCYAWKPAPYGIKSERNPLFKAGEARTVTVVPANQDVATTLLREVETATFFRTSKISAIIETLQPNEFAPMAGALAKCRVPVQTFALTELYRVWALHDPKAAMASALTLSPPLKVAAEAGLVQGWSETDPKAVRAWIDTLPEESQRNRLLSAYLTALARHDPRRLGAVLQSNPGLFSRSTLYGVLPQLATMEPKLAVETAQKFPKGPARRQALATAISAWFQRDSKAAMEYMRSLSLAEGREEILRYASWQSASHQRRSSRWPTRCSPKTPGKWSSGRVTPPGCNRIPWRPGPGRSARPMSS